MKTNLTAQNEALAQNHSTLLAEVQQLRYVVVSYEPSLGTLFQHVAGTDCPVTVVCFSRQNGAAHKALRIEESAASCKRRRVWHLT